MAHDRFLPRNPIRLQGIVARAVGRSVGWQGHSLPEVLGRFRLWIIMDYWWADQSWVHFFKVETIKYGTNIALNMLFNKSSGFCYKCDFFCWFFPVFSNFVHWNPRWRSHMRNFSRIISKQGKDLCCPKISDEFDYGGSVSLDMRIVDRLTWADQFWCSRGFPFNSSHNI